NGAVLSIDRDGGDGVVGDAFILDSFASVLGEEIAAANIGEGEADVAEGDGVFVAVPLIDGLDWRAVGIDEVGVIIRGVLERRQDFGVVGHAVIDAEGIDVDEVVVHHWPEVLGPEAVFVLSGGDAAQVSRRDFAPIVMAEDFPGEVYAGGVVGGD